MANPDQSRKTSLGMQAMGAVPHELPRGEVRARDGRVHVMGAAVTLTLHLLIVGAIVFMNEIDRDHGAKHIDEPQAIEAGLAIKKKSQEGKKSALPQKEVAAKVKPPDAPGVAHNAEQIPPEKKPDKKHDYVPPDAAVYTYKHFSTDALAVLDHLGIAKAHFVGLSMGSYSSLQVGLNAADRALSMTLAAVGSGSELEKLDAFRAQYLRLRGQRQCD